jgi:2-amino-4-hydroxy-6-hydroxymethyldihydropteridine diphosphokinase
LASRDARPPAAAAGRRGIFIALGSNLGDRAANIQGALAALAEHADITVTRMSPIIETAPIGGSPGQPAYLNAVAEIGTALSPQDLLERLMQIEARFGRQRSVPNAPRTLDLDLLLYHETILRSERLSLPHPRMWNRPFVLRPLELLIGPDHLQQLAAFFGQDMAMDAPALLQAAAAPPTSLWPPRPIEQRDVPAVLALVARIFEEYGFILRAELEEPQLVDPLTWFRTRSGEFWVIEQSPEIIATVAAYIRRPGLAELKSLYVDASARRCGLGHQLVQLVIDFARVHQADRLILWTDIRFTLAHRLYERLGFLRFGERDLADSNHSREFGYMLRM